MRVLISIPSDVLRTLTACPESSSALIPTPFPSSQLDSDTILYPTLTGNIDLDDDGSEYAGMTPILGQTLRLWCIDRFHVIDCRIPWTFMVLLCVWLLRGPVFTLFHLHDPLYFSFTTVHYIYILLCNTRESFSPTVSEQRKQPLPFISPRPSYFDLDLNALDIPFSILLVQTSHRTVTPRYHPYWYRPTIHHLHLHSFFIWKGYSLPSHF